MAGSLAVAVVGAARAVVEVAMLALLGQGVLALVAGAGRAGNPIYRLFLIITGPTLRAARLVVPQRIIDRHLPYVAFFVLFWLWILLAYVKRALQS
ncbi:MAG: hypothetical protein PHY45_00165 [Rhodocyclaceae bacterium]|nr:hypothetical protein [Rhodocyclaceae bacterium]